MNEEFERRKLTVLDEMSQNLDLIRGNLEGIEDSLSELVSMFQSVLTQKGYLRG